MQSIGILDYSNRDVQRAPARGFDRGLGRPADQPNRTIMSAKVAKNARVKRTVKALWLEA
jgi:hypothetical protein